MLSCRQIYDLVTEYDEGFLDAGERRQFEAHVVICPPCRGFLSQMRATRARLENDSPPAFTEELADSIVAAFHRWREQRGYLRIKFFFFQPFLFDVPTETGNRFLSLF